MLTLLLPILSRFGGAVLALVSRVPAWCWLGVALAVWGLHWRGKADHAEALVAKQSTALAAAQTAARASETARTHEQQLAARVREISDELQTAQALRDAASRDVARRLRDLAAVRRTSGPGTATATACSSYDGPAAAVISDATREALVDLATDADAVSKQLAGCQAYIRDVVQPGTNTIPTDNGAHHGRPSL